MDRQLALRIVVILAAIAVGLIGAHFYAQGMGY
jgi:hypothetical protein